MPTTTRDRRRHLLPLAEYPAGKMPPEMKTHAWEAADILTRQASERDDCLIAYDQGCYDTLAYTLATVYSLRWAWRLRQAAERLHRLRAAAAANHEKGRS